MCTLAIISIENFTVTSWQPCGIEYAVKLYNHTKYERVLVPDIVRSNGGKILIWRETKFKTRMSKCGYVIVVPVPKP